MGSHCIAPPREGIGLWSDGGGQPAVYGVCFVAGSHRLAVARFAGGFRQLEQCLPALSAVVGKGRIRRVVRGSIARAGLRIRARRWHHRQCSPEGERRKRGTQNQAIGRSRGGLTTKIVALVDALGDLGRFVLLPGQRHDMVGVEPLIRNVQFDALLGDKAFAADWLRAELNQRGASAVIPPRSNRKQQLDYDKEMYKWRHLVENYFAKIKEFWGIATRYDKTETSFAENPYLVATIIAAR